MIWIVLALVAATAYRLGKSSAWLAGYEDALQDVADTDEHLGWVHEAGAVLIPQRSSS